MQISLCRPFPFAELYRLQPAIGTQPMGDALKKVKAGDPMRIPAPAFNLLVDAASGDPAAGSLASGWRWPKEFSSGEYLARWQGFTQQGVYLLEVKAEFEQARSGPGRAPNHRRPSPSPPGPRKRICGRLSDRRRDQATGE